MMRQRLTAIYHNPSHILWVILQQGVVKALLSLKFLLLARFLGPEQLGVLGVMLVLLGIIEGLTDFGLTHAAVQRQEGLHARQYEQIWTVQLLRGALITGIILIAGYTAVEGFKLEYPLALILCMAFIPLVRGWASIGLLTAQRNLGFRSLALLQAAAALCDILLTTGLLLYEKNVVYAGVAMLSAELLRVLMSYGFFPGRPRFSRGFQEIRELASYGKWVFYSNIFIILNNQLDKMLTAFFLGTLQLGVYQFSYKIAQYGISDLTFAFSQYLFPKLSHTLRENAHKAYSLFFFSLIQITRFSMLTLIFLWITMEWLITVLFGELWLSAVPIARLLLIHMSITALMSVLVPYARSTGRPDLVTKTTVVQLIVFGGACALLLPGYGLQGMALSVMCSIAVAVLYTLWQLARLHPGLWSDYFRRLGPLLPLLALMAVPSFIPSSLTLFILSLLAYAAGILMLLRSFRQTPGDEPVPVPQPPAGPLPSAPDS